MMTRDELKERLDLLIMHPKEYKEREAVILAEYDRLTALNARLLEACKLSLEWLDDGCFTSNEFYSVPGNIARESIEATIRAAEEGQNER